MKVLLVALFTMVCKVYTLHNPDYSTTFADSYMVPFRNMKFIKLNEIIIIITGYNIYILNL